MPSSEKHAKRTNTQRFRSFPAENYGAFTAPDLTIFSARFATASRSHSREMEVGEMSNLALSFMAHPGPSFRQFPAVLSRDEAVSSRS
jgi:hypothetical protein